VPPARSPRASLARYREWLAHQPLATRSRQTYAAQVGAYVDWLVGAAVDAGNPLHDGHARDHAVREYKSHLKTVRRVSPRSVNLALAAIDHFYRFLGTGKPNVRREDLPARAPRALDVDERRRFLRAVERCAGPRDRAVALLLLYTGLRLGECAALNTADVAVSARKGRVIVRSGKDDAHREVPLNAEVRSAVGEWLRFRTGQLALLAARGAPADTGALWLSRTGDRLSPRSIDFVLRRLGKEAGLQLSAHTLRHTCFTGLVRRSNDLVLVAELAGHRRLETTRRYSLPSAADRQAAMEALHIDC
jgi:site-specific recombinase XerD